MKDFLVRGMTADGLVTIDQFFQTKLKTAKVLTAEKVEGADKLLKLQIEVGNETRQLVAGVAPFYSPEAIIGKTIIIVANLKPAKIRGIESQGMLLAAKDGKNLKLVTRRPAPEIPEAGVAQSPTWGRTGSHVFRITIVVHSKRS